MDTPKNTTPVKFKITIVDDEKELVKTIRDLLEPRNFEVSYAYNGVDGLAVIRGQIPDLVILDIMMPGMDGRDVLIELKNSADTKNIPVIMLTAKDEQFEVDYGMELGACSYVTKPYQARHLLKHIEKILETKNA